MLQNTEIIKKALIDAYKAPTEQLTKDYFLIVLKNIQTYNLQLENFYNKIQVLSRPIIAENASDTTKTYEIFRKLRYLEPEADKILKDGYIILERSSANTIVKLPQNLVLWKEKQYKTTTLSFIKRV